MISNDSNTEKTYTKLESGLKDVADITFYDAIYKHGDTTRQYSWKSLRDSIFGLLTIYMITRDSSTTEGDPDSRTVEIAEKMKTITKQIALGKEMNHPALAPFGSDKIFNLLSIAFGLK